MRKGSKRRLIVAVVLAGLLGVSSIALADHVEQRDDDTIVSFGYDELNRILAVNSGDNDTPWVCNFADGALTAGYGTIVEGFLEIESLMIDEFDEWEFDSRPEHQVSDDYTAVGETDTTPYSDGECVAAGAVVGGPNGQVNHGQFMKAAKSLIDIKGQGCIVREFAKLDLGKASDGTMVRTPDVGDPLPAPESGEIEFTTFEADCSKPNKEGKGRPESPGKSGDAPGHTNGDG